MARVSFSNEVVKVAEFAVHYSDSEESLRQYFNPVTNPTRFAGDTDADVLAGLNSRLDELDKSSSFTILSAIEAVFRVDYLQRCDQREKDPLSRAFRALHKRKSYRVRLEDEILDAWKQHSVGASTIISDLKSALRYRHWLAHGRYWQPKLGKKFDFLSLYTLATEIIESFPLIGVHSAR